MNRFKLFLFVVLPFIACGCFEVSQQITINKDGSGTIVERFMMSTVAFKQLSDVFASFSSAKKSKANKPDIYDKKKLKADAANYGPGVTYVSSKRLRTDTKEGYEAVYAFKDIGALRLNQNPSEKGPAGPGGAPGPSQENISFQFERGTPAKLTVIFPQKAKPPKDKKSKGAKKDKAADQKELDELRDIFKDFYIGITIRPKGTIVDTNATYNDDGTITLLEMDFKKLLTDEKQFESFVNKEPKTIEETKALLKNLPGFKIELNDRVSIAFE